MMLKKPEIYLIHFFFQPQHTTHERISKEEIDVEGRGVSQSP